MFPAIPKRPVARATTDDSFNHFIPVDFAVGVRNELLVHGVFGADSDASALTRARPVTCLSHPLVDRGAIVSPHGVAVLLINWDHRRIGNLEVVLNADVTAAVDWTNATAATGAAVTAHRLADGRTKLVLARLEEADAIVLR